MLNELTEINNLLHRTLALNFPTVREFKVGATTLGAMDFIKEDHGAIRPTLRVFTVDTILGPNASVESAANALLSEIDDAATHVPGNRVLYISPVYFDYKPGQLFHENVSLTIKVDVAMYSYDGTTYRSVLKSADGHGGVTYIPENTTHMPLTMGPFKIRVIPRNVLRDVQGKDTSIYFQKLITAFDQAVLEQRALLTRMHEAAMVYDKVDKEIENKSFYAAALLAQEFFAAQVTYLSEADDMGPGFLMNNLVFHPHTLLDMILGAGGFYGKVEDSHLKCFFAKPAEAASEVADESMPPPGSKAYTAFHAAESLRRLGKVLKFIQIVSDYFSMPVVALTGENEEIIGYKFSGKIIRGEELSKLIVEHWRAAQDSKPERITPPDIQPISTNEGTALALQIVPIMDAIESQIELGSLDGAADIICMKLNLPVTCSPDLYTQEPIFVVANQYLWKLSYLRALVANHPQ